MANTPGRQRFTASHLFRTFFVWAKRSKINSSVTIGHRQAKTTPTIAQDQRLAWLKELLPGDSESLPYRIAGILLMLYGQPLTKIASLCKPLPSPDCCKAIARFASRTGSARRR